MLKTSMFTRLILLISLLGAMSSEAFGTDFTWTGNTDSEWGNANNWNPNSSFPGNPFNANNDTALFNSTGLIKTINVGSNADSSFSTLTFQDSYTLNVDTSISLAPQFTEVQAGTLVIGDISHWGSSLQGNVQIDSGATLSGFGRMNKLDNFGTVAPGDANTIGTLSVDNGNFILEPGSFFKVKITNPPPFFPTNDQVQIGFLYSPDLASTSNVVITPQSGFKLNYFYSLTNFSSQPITTLPHLIQPSAFNGILDGSYGALEYIIFGLTSAVPNGATTYANQQLALAQIANWFDSQLQDRILGYASDKEGGKNTSPDDPTLWMIISETSSKLLNVNNGFKTNPKHGALGLEKSTNNSLCGMSLAYTHFSSDGLLGVEHANVKGNLYQLGGYSSRDQHDWRFGANVTLGITDDMDSHRWIDMGMGSAIASSQFQAHSFSAAAQVSYLGLHVNHQANVQPLATLQYQWLSRNHFKEQGSTGLELDVSHANYYSLRSRLGLAFENTLNNNNIHPFGLAAWEHEFVDNLAKTSANFPSLDISFNDLNGTPISRESLVGKLGLSITRQKIWHFAAFYEGRHANHYHENAAKLQASYNIL